MRGMDAVPNVDEAFEAFRNDLVSYLAARLGASADEVLDRLGDCLVELGVQGGEHAKVR
jgi:hypothetical protein